MSFRITGLPATPFRHLFGLPDEKLAAHGALRRIATETPGFPDRIELRDAEPGESLLLVNYTHQPADTPYRASHAVYVLENPGETFDRENEVPEVLRRRMLSLRGFDAEGLLVDADLTDGTALETAVAGLFAHQNVAYIHAHYAKPGCYAARIDRTG